MNCPYCRNADAKVVDSRDADSGSAIRRRRECLSCSRRYTTFERIEALPLRVLKRSGTIEPYEREKVLEGILKACKNRPVTPGQVELLGDEIEAAVFRNGASEVSTQELGVAVLDHLRNFDDVAYLRFASVYKDFQEVSDFERELGLLLQKSTPPKGVSIPSGGPSGRGKEVERQGTLTGPTGG